MDFATLHPKQQEAVNACLDKDQRRIVPITGEAGTGKTSIMQIVHSELTEAGFSVGTVAPTGKASKRVKEATGIKDAMTMHRALEFTHPGDPDPKTGKATGFSVPRRFMPDNPLEYDVILADEYAMVNNDLHRSLIDALMNGSRICMFGDENQLEPIEEDKRLLDQPTPFQRMLKDFNGIKLEHNYRQAAGSGVALNCSRILRGWVPVQKDDFNIKYTDQPVDLVMNYIADMQSQGVDFTGLDNQIISPQNKSWIGTVKLNGRIQSTIWSDMSDSIDLPRHEWAQGDSVRIKVGDKVVCTKNMYEVTADNDEKGLFNGECGIVRSIDEYEAFYVDVGDRVVYIPRTVQRINRNGQSYLTDPRKDIDLAYVLTTHKCQGSEYKRVIYLMNKSVQYMLTRRNFYTGVSRAREHVTVITDQRSIQSAVYTVKQWRGKK